MPIEDSRKDIEDTDSAQKRGGFVSTLGKLGFYVSYVLSGIVILLVFLLIVLLNQLGEGGGYLLVLTILLLIINLNLVLPIVLFIRAMQNEPSSKMVIYQVVTGMVIIGAILGISWISPITPLFLLEFIILAMVILANVYRDKSRVTYDLWLYPALLYIPIYGTLAFLGRHLDFYQLGAPSHYAPENSLELASWGCLVAPVYIFWGLRHIIASLSVG